MWHTKLEVRRVVRSPVITFHKDELVLGGDEWADVDLVIADGDHAALRVDARGDVWVTDGGRELATHVNGVRITEPTKITPADTVSFATDMLDIGTSYVALAAAPVKSPVPHCNWQIELASRYAYPAMHHVLRGDALVIGSALPAQLVLESEDVSPRHCVVHRTAGGFEVEDLDSELGTLVNGTAIAGRVALGPADTLEIGEYEVRIPAPAEQVDEPVWEVALALRGDVVTFRQPRITIGRDAANDIPLVKSRRASRRHCTLVVEDGEVRVEDHASTHGTWLNGRRIQESPFAVHDRLYVDDLVIALTAPPVRVG